MPWPAVADVFSGFDKVFSRMTAAECVSICDAYGLLDSTPTVPDYLTAQGALTWMAYNDGNGSYYDPANPSWDPSSLPNKTLWLDSSEPGTLFSDAAGTTPQSSNNGPVGLWKSKVGSYSLEQAQVSAPDYRPTLQLGVLNSRNSIRFDPGGGNTNTGANSRFLQSGSSIPMTDIISATQPFTLFMVAQFTVVDTNNARLIGDTGGNSVLKLNGTPVSNISAQVNLTGGGGTPVALANPGPVDATNPFVLVWQWVSGTGVSLSFNGATPTTTAGTGTLSHPGEFYVPNGQPNFKCRYDLFELIVCSGSSAGLSAADQTKAGTYLAAKYGAPWAGYNRAYAGNLFINKMRASDVRAFLKARFHESIPAFIQKVVGANQRRAAELTADAPPSVTDPPASAPPASTKIVFWNVTNAGSLVTNKYGGGRPGEFRNPG